jgi:transposase
MARPARRIACDEGTRAELERIARSRRGAARAALRARMVLRCLGGETVKDAAAACGVARETVIVWRDRFAEGGVAALSDRPRGGRPAGHGAEFRETVLDRLGQPPPEGHGQWDGALLAKEIGCSRHAVWRLLRGQRISLARKRSWCVSTDPEFAAKAADVVGLYLAKDERALVVCIDEKPNIQALERRAGYAVSSDGKLVRGMGSTYRRNGTLNLFAALEVATGRVHAKTTDPGQKTKKGFVAFMGDLLRELPEAEEYHVVMDNHAIHKRHEAWLLEHPNVFFHYTPTSASWLNMVEIWLGILTRKSLRGASFGNTRELCRHIGKFVKSYNLTAKPFVWRKREVRGAQLSNKADNFCN